MSVWWIPLHLVCNISASRFAVSHCLQSYGEPVSMETQQGQSVQLAWWVGLKCTLDEPNKNGLASQTRAKLALLMVVGWLYVIVFMMLYVIQVDIGVSYQVYALMSITQIEALYHDFLFFESHEHCCMFHILLFALLH